MSGEGSWIRHQLVEFNVTRTTSQLNKKVSTKHSMTTDSRTIAYPWETPCPWNGDKSSRWPTGRDWCHFPGINL